MVFFHHFATAGLGPAIEFVTKILVPSRYRHEKELQRGQTSRTKSNHFHVRPIPKALTGREAPVSCLWGQRRNRALPEPWRPKRLPLPARQKPREPEHVVHQWLVLNPQHRVLSAAHPLAKMEAAIRRLHQCFQAPHEVSRKEWHPCQARTEVPQCAPESPGLPSLLLLQTSLYR